MPSAALHTLGCKVNQYETQKIADELVSRGFDICGFSDKADVYIINTCTVTCTADSKSRQAIRSAISRNPNAHIIVTGCYAETSSDAVSSIGGVSLVIGNSDKSKIADAAVSMIGSGSVVRNCRKPANGRETRTRALLKIQDGCDQFCSYCAVPLARSRMWSKPFQEAIDEARNLADNGYKEIVLTGIRTGLYRDRGTLTDLIEEMCAVDGIERIRISSIEMTDIPDGLIQLMASSSKVCPHLHLPLQSGDDSVLKRMNRPYNSEQFLEFVRMARSLVPDIAVTTDIIVGFPGESIREFENTCRTARMAEFSKAHIFRYSPREGTAAALLPDDVPPSEKEARSRLLSEIVSASADRFAERLVGRNLDILVEGKRYRNGLYSGLTGNYVRVFLDAEQQLKGCIVNAKIGKMSDGRLFGTINA